MIDLTEIDLTEKQKGIIRKFQNRGRMIIVYSLIILIYFIGFMLYIK